MDGTPFNVLLQQAATLKTAQMASFRTKFDNFDIWYQHSLYSQQDIISARSSETFVEIYSFALKCKLVGNQLYENNNFDGAVNEYERSLSLFRWIESIEPDWKNKAIEDSSLLEHEYTPQNNEETQLIQALNISSVLNLSQCYLKQKEFKYCIAACTYILSSLDSMNIKALYRRAQARIIPLSSGTVEYKLALQDLRTAYELQPNDMKIKTEYLRLKELLLKQSEKDKRTFNNLFSRDHFNYDDDNTDLITDNTTTSTKSNISGSSGANNMTFQDALNTLRDLESTIKTYEQDGNKEGVQLVREKINKIQTILVQYKQECDSQQNSKNNSKKISSFEDEKADFFNPSEQMILDAKQHGVDLTDKKVQQIMYEMNQARLNIDTNADDDGTLNSTAATSTKHTTSSSQPSPEVIFKAAMHKIYTNEATQLAAKVLHDMKREELVDMLVRRQLFTFEVNNMQVVHTSNTKKHKRFDTKGIREAIFTVVSGISDDKLNVELTEYIVKDIVEIREKADEEPTTPPRVKPTTPLDKNQQRDNTNELIITMLKDRYYEDENDNYSGKSTSAASTTSSSVNDGEDSTAAVRKQQQGWKWTRGKYFTTVVGILAGLLYIVISSFYTVWKEKQQLDCGAAEGNEACCAESNSC